MDDIHPKSSPDNLKFATGPALTLPQAVVGFFQNASPILFGFATAASWAAKIIVGRWGAGDLINALFLLAF